MLKMFGRCEFMSLVRQKTEQKDRYAVICWDVIGALTANWMTELGSQKTAIMLFLVNRTLYYRKEAQQVWHYQWYDGVVDRKGNKVCDGLGMSERTLRKHLNELIEADFVDAFCSTDSDNGSETTARLFAINFKKLLAPYHAGSDMPSLNKPKALKKLEKTSEIDDETGSKNCQEGVADFATHNSTYKRFTKVNLSARAPRSGTVNAGTENNAPVMRVPRNKLSTETTPVYLDPEVLTAREVAAAIVQRDRGMRAARVAKAVTTQPWMLTKKELQAMVDTQMEAYYPSEPRMLVTDKEFGLLKKRLKESQPKDFTGFLKHIFGHWTIIASQHRNAVMRNDNRRYNEKEIPRIPCFKSLAYRLPYFLQCYSNFLADRRTVEKVEDDSREIKQLQRQLSQAKRENRVLSERSSRRTTHPEPDEYEPARKRYTRNSAIKMVENATIDLGEELPTYEEIEERKAAEKRHVG